VRIIVNFIQRDGIAIHCIAEDAKTVVSGWSSVPDQPTLERLLRYAGTTDSEIEEARVDLRRWSHGGVYITLTPGRKNLLQIKPEYAKQLGLW
jgi:hypothetical protein